MAVKPVYMCMYFFLPFRSVSFTVCVRRSIGTFARALDCTSTVRQPSLHMSAAAASRDITLVLHSPSFIPCLLLSCMKYECYFHRPIFMQCVMKTLQYSQMMSCALFYYTWSQCLLSYLIWDHLTLCGVVACCQCKCWQINKLMSTFLLGKFFDHHQAACHGW